MKPFYKQSFGALLLTTLAIGTAYGQKTKIKTITIVDGDTTVNEEIITDKNFTWNEKDEKKGNVKMMKIITSGDDSVSISSNEKIKIITDGDEDGKAFTKKIIVMDDGGKVITEDIENSFSYVIEVDDNGKKEKKIIHSEADEKAMKGKHKVIKMNGVRNIDSELPLKNININVDEKTHTIKLDLKSESKDAINVVVMDENGKQVFYDSQKSDSYKKDIKLEKNGVYFLSIIQNKKVLNERIVLE